MEPFALFLFGPPGSGKSTQAELVAREFGAAQIDTGSLLHKILSDPARQNDPKVQQERVKQEVDGQLNDSIWVAGLVIEEARKLHAAGKSIVFSGSPRTIFEAEVEAPILQQLYPARLFYVILEVHEETTLFRNSHRRICATCGKLYTWLQETKNVALCTVCGGPLVTRPDDKPEVIKRRMRVYRERTAPLFSFLQSQGVASIKIDGEPVPDVVFSQIKAALQKVL